MYYLIKETLVETKEFSQELPCVALFTGKEWEQNKSSFSFFQDLDEERKDLYSTHANVRQDCLAGSFSIVNRKDLTKDDQSFSFALNDHCVVFVDDSGYVKEALTRIHSTKKWQDPGLDRFFYDFLDDIVKDDLRIMEKYEMELEMMEDTVDGSQINERLNTIRSEVRRFFIHYQQLLDVAQELEENENGFFEEDRLRYFRSYITRLDRMLNISSYLRDYVIQIEDMNQDRISIRQNEIMTILTVVTTIFMPLTLIVGWYGMNFRYMPELNQYYAYPILIVICILIVLVLLYYFKRKKWL